MTVTRLLRVICLAAILVSLAPAAQAQQRGEAVLYQESFDSGQAPGWQLEAGWSIVQDAGNAVLAGEGHYWARPAASFAGDFRLQFRLKLLRGSIHLVYRMNQAGRYFIGFREAGTYLSKQYWPDTFLSDLSGSGTPHALGTWHQIEIAGQGPLLRLTVDGQVEWTYTDAEPLLDGSFAFETLDDSAAYVDNIVVYGPPPPTPDTRLAWTRTGGPLGGLGYDVRMRPGEPDAMYVTDAWSGVFVSSDAGQTWSASNIGISTRTGTTGDAIPLFCLTIDPSDPQTIWAGTQWQRGIFKSTDGGRSWAKMDSGIVESDGISFRGFGVDPRDSNTVYAAAEVSSWVWNGQPRNGREFDMTQGVVYKTTDGGRSWQVAWRGDNLARYVWIDPRDSNVIYVSTGIFDREAANSDPAARAAGGVGILKSTDGGQTWRQMNNGLGNLYVGTLFMHPQNPDVLLAGTGNNQYYDQNGAYLSTDRGDSWRRTLPDDNITSVEIAVSDTSVAYAGSSNAVYRSRDGGATWSRVVGGDDGWGPPGVRAGFPIDFQLDPRDPDRLFANNYGGGNFLSTDGGRTWAVASQGYTGAQVRAIAVDPAAPGKVLAAARSGLFASYDGGGDWIGLSYPPVASLEWNAVAIDPHDSQHVLGATNWNGLLVESRDGGRTWRVASQAPGANMGWRAIAFAPPDSQVAYAGSGAWVSAGTFASHLPASGVYVSRDGGKTWSSANDNTSRDATVSGLSVDPRDALTVYAATNNHGVLKTTDGGVSWLEVNAGMTGAPQAMSVTVDPADPNVVLAGRQGDGVYRSTDGGGTWKRSAAGLNPEASVTDIAIDPANPQVVYAADVFGGVYRSDDGGGAWRAINTGLGNRAVNALALSSDGQHLYAATEGGGVFRLDASGAPPVPAPTPVPPLPTGAPPAATQPPPPGPTHAPATQPPPAGTPPSGGVRLCGGALALPLGLAGWVWLARRRRRGSS